MMHISHQETSNNIGLYGYLKVISRTRSLEALLWDKVPKSISSVKNVLMVSISKSRKKEIYGGAYWEVLYIFHVPYNL